MVSKSNSRKSKSANGAKRTWTNVSRASSAVSRPPINLFLFSKFRLYEERKGALDNAEADDNFDVAVEDALTDRPAKRGKSFDSAKLPRHARDQKFGFGGAGRRSKQNTKASTDEIDVPSHHGRGAARNARGGRGAARGARGGRGRGTKRLGKSRRATAK